MKRKYILICNKWIKKVYEEDKPISKKASHLLRKASSKIALLEKSFLDL